MNFEFDNEMDFLLRDHAKRAVAAENSFAETGANPSAHLDADDLAAFAENSVPQFARQKFAAHLADCTNCRRILSSLTLINEAEQEQSAAANVRPAIVQKPARANWLESFQKLFAFPTLGYATAGLAILLVGTIAFVALRNPNDAAQTTIAKLEQTELAPTQSAVAPAQQSEPEQTAAVAAEAPSSAATANSATAAPRSAAQNSNSASAVQPPATREPSNNRSDAAANTAMTTTRDAQTAPTDAEVDAASPTARARRSNQNAVAERNAPNRPAAQQPNRELEAPRQNRQEQAEDKSGGIGGLLAPPVIAAPMTATPESRTISGKNFQKRYDVWQDSSYKSTQKEQLVLRGSKEYKKLPAGLRAIAEKLRNEVIVVWQGKAYRIR